MEVADNTSISAFEQAVEGLQEERLVCVRRLEAALLAETGGSEIETWLQRIDNINTLLMRLAEAHVIA